MKQKIIKKYGADFSVKTLIETGTYLGDMVNSAKETFSSIYSIELNKNLYKAARKRFVNFPHIKIIFGDSKIILQNILNNINEPCLFWLDAHYSHKWTEGSSSAEKTPLIKELESISKHSVKNHILLIDDARLYNGLRKQPSLQEIKKFISVNFKEYQFEINNDIIRIFRKL